MTRILALSLYYPPHHYGGYEIACAQVMSRLSRRGHEVAVLTSDHRVPGRDGGGSGVTVHRWLQPYFRDDDLYSPHPLTRWRMERANQAALARALAEHRPDVASVWHMGAMSLGLLTTLAERSVPLVYVISDDWLCYGPQLDAWSRMWARRPRLGRWLRPVLGVPTVLPDLGATGSFCFASEDNRRRAEESSRWSFPDHTIVYLGIDRSSFSPGEPGADGEPDAGDAGDAGDTGDGWYGHLLYAGRYDPRKGIATLIRALALLDPQHRLEIRGTGDPGHRRELAALAGELGVGDRVELGPPLDGPDLARRYRAADAVVFPSEWPEPFGLVPLEAMSCRTPVVASGTGGSGEYLVDGENCVRFEPGDPAGLAGAVRRLAADPGLRERLVTNGERTAEHFDVERLTDVLEAWHRGAAAGFPDGRPQRRRFSLASLEPVDSLELPSDARRRA